MPSVSKLSRYVWCELSLYDTCYVADDTCDGNTETERYANEVIAYYATSLADLVGEGYKDASLDYLANFWLDESREAFFRSTRMSDLLIAYIVTRRRTKTVGKTALRIPSRPSLRRRGISGSRRQAG